MRRTPVSLPEQGHQTFKGVFVSSDTLHPSRGFVVEGLFKSLQYRVYIFSSEF
jgi:hypothetical protein